MNNMKKTSDSCILYGVPKVSYSMEECTPFCASMKACLNYLGQQIDYSDIMAITGAAFRLRWNINCWDGGNVDIMNIYEDRYEAFRRGFQAAGRSFKVLKRSDSDKQGFIRFIKAEIDEGRPVIAFGIIGPPEACLITGYRNNGEVLLGWNCFQDNQEYAKGVNIDESGYFITDSWWVNEYTTALISVGEKQEALSTHKEVLLNAVDILSKESVIFYGNDNEIAAEYAGGQKAYDCWANAIADDKEFPDGAILPILYERIICQNDAQDMVGEGRSYAACYLEKVAKEYPQAETQCKKAAQYFRSAAECTFGMNGLKGGYVQSEEVIRRFAEPGIRKQIVTLINQAKEYEAKACGLINEAVTLL